MIQAPLKRGQKCHWLRSGLFTTCYFLSFNPMPVAPHVVKVRHNGMEYLLKDCEVFTEAQRFERTYSQEIEALRSRDKFTTKKKVSVNLAVPYSRILRVCKIAPDYGVNVCPRNTNAIAQSEKS